MTPEPSRRVPLCVLLEEDRSECDTGSVHDSPRNVHFGQANNRATPPAKTRTSRGTGSSCWRWWRCQQTRCVFRRAAEDPSNGCLATAANRVVVFLILASTLCAVLVTVQELEEAYAEAFQLLEEVFTAVFSLEIVLRMWMAASWKEYVASPSNLVDVLATLPWYSEVLYCSAVPELRMDGRFRRVAGSFRTLRMVRMVRLAKVARHSETVTMIMQSILASRTGLFEGLFVLVTFVTTGTVLSATAVYAAESQVPQGAFTSIPASMWWALTTISTVGYGDMVPTTVEGKLVGCSTMVGGTLIMSLAVAIVTSSFTEQYRHKSAQKARQKKLARRSEQGDTLAAQQANRLSKLLERLAKLEEDTTNVLCDLEGELLHAAAASRLSPSESWRPAEPAERTRLLVECLRGQSGAFFRAAQGLAHSVVLAEQPKGCPPRNGKVMHLAQTLRVPSICEVGHAAMRQQEISRWQELPSVVPAVDPRVEV